MENLSGKNPDPGLLDSLSTETRVTAQTPPTFIVFSNDDNVVPVENGIMFYQALRKEGVPASIHVYDHGGTWVWNGTEGPGVEYVAGVECGVVEEVGVWE
ncbi:MAG: prolyl oligopeptidase family serine peptidase [Bacteroidota bacterium]